MLKPVLAAAAVLAIAGVPLVYAQQRGDNPGYGAGPRAEYRHRLSTEDAAAFTDARIAALKAGLELTPDQVQNWPAFEQAMRDVIDARLQIRQSRWGDQGQTPQQGQNPGTPFDRMALRADDLAKMSAALKRLADAGAPLYQSLTDAQRGRFDMLAHVLRPHNRMAERGWRGEGDHWFWHHFRRLGDGPRGDEGDGDTRL
jgi:zinc resistance-associated protein